MQYRSRCLYCLDTIYLIITLPLIILSTYLLVSSISSKLADCSGFYTNCFHSEKDLRDVQSNSRATEGSKTAIIGDVGRRETAAAVAAAAATRRRRLLINIQSKSNFNLRREYLTAQLGRNYDWLILDQYAIVISLIVLTIFALVSVFNYKRKLILVSILLYLVLLIQLALIETSDDRDFPENIFRHGYSIAHYAILYLDNTPTSLILKVTFLLLVFLEYIVLIIYFVLLRYDEIYQHNLDIPPNTTTTHNNNINHKSTTTTSGSDTPTDDLFIDTNIITCKTPEEEISAQLSAVKATSSSSGFSVGPKQRKQPQHHKNVQ